MAHLSKVFTERKVDIPNRSGFDLSFENLLTMKCGTLVPVLCEEVIPNETFSLGHMTQVQLPPMATDFYGRVDFRLEAFFVPNRILWGGWQNFWTMPVENPYGAPTVRPTTTPSFKFAGHESLAPLKRGTLADYLGWKNGTDYATTAPVTGYSIPNILPFLAYHKVYDEWYRNSKIQKPLFVKDNSGTVNAELYTIGQTQTAPVYNTAHAVFADGSNIWTLRQRNWAKDYYTTASLYPQGSSTPASLSFDVTMDGSEAGSGKFTIPALRSANVLQRWLERNNIAGYRYADQIKAQYGVLPADAIMDRPIFLGSSKFGIYNKSVYQSNPATSNDTASTNPFKSVGAKYATSNGFGEDSLIDNFTSSEHGYIIVLASIVPHAYYGTGIRRQLLHSKVGDFAIPLLQGVGEQKIYASELTGENSATTFGYTLEHSEYKYHDDEVHGLLCDGESLKSFCLQRSFKGNTAPSLGSAFLEIPTTFMDQVTATSSDMSNYGAWADIYFNFKRVSPLSEYVIPTLGDLTNTHKETIPVGGRQL